MMNDGAKTAVITGGTKGMGRAFSELFAAQGFHLCVCARTAADLEAMKAEWAIRFPDRTLHTCAADLGKKSDVFEFAAFVQDQWPQFDVLINNAGLYLPGTISSEPNGVLETMLESNLFSAYHLTRALLPLLRARGAGHIFNICSIASREAVAEAGAYTISKFALLGFSKALREELKNAGIKVTSVLPGSTWSSSWQGSGVAQERLLQPEDVARAVWAAYELSAAAVVEELVIQPQEGRVQ